MIDDERKTLSNELRKEFDKIRYGWIPPKHLSNNDIKKIINLLRGNHIYFDNI